MRARTAPLSAGPIFVLAIALCSCGDPGGGGDPTLGSTVGSDPSAATFTEGESSQGGMADATTAAPGSSGLETSASETGDDPGPVVTPGGPVLFFTDLVIGPRRGNSDTSEGQDAGVDGAIVTVWGKHLASGEAAPVVEVGGVEARVYGHGPATQGADLYTRMGIERVEFQIPGDAPLDDAPIIVHVDGVPSNALPFAPRDVGNIYYLSPGGSDDGDGSWSQPWLTFEAAAAVVDDGDIVYVTDGWVDDTGQGADAALVGLDTSGTAALPKALVAYPGATVLVGGVCEPSGHALLNNYSYAANAGSSHWVISKLRIESPPDCPQDNVVGLGDGFRLVGNYLSNPRTNDGCQSGSVQCGGLGRCGDDLFVLGNELAYAQTENAATGSKQCHGFYLSGDRQEEGLERGRTIAWNYIHDCANNRAINLYNESYNGQGAPRALLTEHDIHDNWVENQRGIGLLLGSEIVGDNWIYNNIFVATGLGPEFPDGGAFWPFQIQPGSAYSPTPTQVYVHNNLVYGESYLEGPDYAMGLMSVTQDASTTLDLRNNVLVSTRGGVPYLASGTAVAGQDNLWFGAGAPPDGEVDAIADDPLLVDPAAHDFHPGASSPVKGAGTPSPFATLDFDGIPRDPEAWSLGPYQ
jgi:hypothetical protein